MKESKRPWRMRILLVALALIVVIAVGAIARDGDTDSARTAPPPRVSTR